MCSLFSRFASPGPGCAWAWVCFVPRAFVSPPAPLRGQGQLHVLPSSSQVFLYPAVSAGMLALLCGVCDGNALWEELCDVTVCCADLDGQAGMGFFSSSVILFYFKFVRDFCLSCGVLCLERVPCGRGSMQRRVCMNVCAATLHVSPWHLGLVAGSCCSLGCSVLCLKVGCHFITVLVFCCCYLLPWISGMSRMRLLSNKRMYLMCLVFN